MQHDDQRCGLFIWQLSPVRATPLMSAGADRQQRIHRIEISSITEKPPDTARGVGSIRYRPPNL
jgi:hypothetical protein